jgi:hypothetical protein
MKSTIIHCLKLLKYFLNLILYGLLLPKAVIPKATKPVCYALGNGPSLAIDIADKIDFLQTQDVIVVNQFIQTELSKLIKPSFYVLADPAYWIKSKIEETSRLVEKTMEELNKVEWTMNLFVPAAGFAVVSRKIDNPHINVVKFRKANVGSFIMPLAYRAYKKNRAMPKLQTVMNAAVFLAINMGYKEINVLGIEHDWFKNYVLTENNVLQLIDTHFYHPTPENCRDIIDPETGKPITVHKALRAAANALESHHRLNAYARYRRVQIYNLSSTTFVDAYARKKFTM